MLKNTVPPNLLQFGDDTPVSFLNAGQLRQLILCIVLSAIREDKTGRTEAEVTGIDHEYVNELAARRILSATEKPVSKNLFYGLRGKGHFQAYHIGGTKRVVYKRSELLACIAPKSTPLDLAVEKAA